ncbi:MAG: efflux RND transporter periplasmic adaptor subunit [Pseudomonadota bacterium]
MIRAIVVPVAIVAVFLVGAFALVATAPALEPETPDPVPLTVRALRVEPEAVQLTVRSQGSVAPAEEAQLIPEVSGRIEWVSPALVAGGSIAAGEPLLKIAVADYRNAAARSEAGLKRAEAEQENAAYEQRRLAGLAERQLVSKSEAEAALRRLRVADAALEEARINARQAALDLSRTTITAPFTGLVRTENVAIGQFVSRGAAVATLYSAAAAEIRLPIADRQLKYLDLPFGVQGTLPAANQAAVTLTAEYAGERLRWPARIVRTEAAIDSSSRMVYLVARVDSREGVPPPAVGLFVEATIEGRVAEDIYVLPRSALRNDRQLLIIDPDDRLRFRPIEPLRIQDEELLVQSGLNPGDRVCISQIQTVVEGMSVLPLLEAEPVMTPGLPLSQL